MKLRTCFFSFLVALSSVISCSEGGADNIEIIDVDFRLPSVIDVPIDTKEYTFSVIDGKAPLVSDVFLLSSESGISIPCAILNVSSSGFTVSLNAGEGNYNVYIKRGSQKKLIGSTKLQFVEDIDFTPDPGSTVYGLVSCEGEGVPGVVVSDGIEVTLTDERGIYQLSSEKKWGYVFISIPSGYEVPAEGILPRFHNYLNKGKDELERSDFDLVEVNQDNYSMLFFGDMHLANKSTDRLQFTDFTADVNDYLADNAGKRVYAATLGDMTWDYYWYSSKYDFINYLEEMNSQIKGLQVFHTMGNHDNDYLAKSDFDAATYYVSKIAPTYYSFNIGDVHYVVLDDINCSKYDGTISRNYYTDVTTEQLNWLEKDLSFVPKGNNVILMAHAQVFSVDGLGFKNSLTNADQLLGILDGYKVNIVTGHTHRVYNVTPEDEIVAGRDVFEHNSGAVCATWWHTGDVTPGIHISTDGAPGGYAVWDISGTDLRWRFKATSWPESYQFRTYDLNNVSFSYDDVPNMPGQFVSDFKPYVDAFPDVDNNDVLINVWNWNSKWKVSVKDENDNELEVERVLAYDPLHIKALAIPRYNNSSLTSKPMFMTSRAAHFFKVRAEGPDTDLYITVEDEFGNVWSETMARPRAFSIQEYKTK